MMSPPQPDVEDLVSPETPNAWIFYDYGLLEDILVPGNDLPSLDPSPPIWSSPSLPCSTPLRFFFSKLRESNQSLQEKINELKTEKNELREEKQRLKTEKDNLKRQVKALGSEPGFVPQAHAIATPFSYPKPSCWLQAVALGWLPRSFHVAILASCCC
ncbi:hypothetical protein GQ457_12G017860 [Hibiscus cannabinus]